MVQQGGLGPATRSMTLVGRDAEMDELRGSLERAAGGSAEAVLVAGEAGFGKTSLVKALEADAIRQGFTTAWGHFWETVDTPPFWAWSQVLRKLHAHPDWSDVAGWVASELQPLAEGEPDHVHRSGQEPERARFVLFRAVSALLRQLAQTQPVMVVIEDLHAADESSLFLFRSLVEEHRSDHLLLIGTYDPNNARRRGRHAALIDEIGRKARSLSLRALDEEEVGILFNRIVPALASGPILSVVYEATEGNPFFVEETAKLLSSRGTLNRPDYSRGFVVPEGARGLIRARLMSLPEEAQEILAVAAVLGREFKIDLLAEVTEIPPDTVLDLLHDPLSAGLIEESGIGSYRFTHVLLRETAYEELKAAKRMRLHRRVAEVLEDLYGDDEANHLQELAHHWFKAAQGGDLTKTIRFAEAAAEQALARHAYEEAERLYQRALRASESLKSSRELRERLKHRVQIAQERGCSAVAPIPQTSTSEATFKNEGDYWRLRFGGAENLLKSSKGLSHVAKLLENPGKEIHSLELASFERGPGSSATSAAQDGLDADGLGDLGPILDDTAKKAYRARIQELEEEVEEARLFNDTEKAARADAERSALIQQIAGAVGLGGRDRKTGSASERARVSVTRNIKDAVRRISDADPALGHHLQVTVRTGTYCSYTPDPRLPIEWST